MQIYIFVRRHVSKASPNKATVLVERGRRGGKGMLTYATTTIYTPYLSLSIYLSLHLFVLIRGTCVWQQVNSGIPSIQAIWFMHNHTRMLICTYVVLHVPKSPQKDFSL